MVDRVPRIRSAFPPLAVTLGIAWAEERRRALAAEMTAAERAEARSRLDAWRAKPD